MTSEIVGKLAVTMEPPAPATERERVAAAYRTLRHAWLSIRAWPLVRHVRAMQLRRLRPLANGRQRGEPVIRYYWRRFLERHHADITGDAIEIGDTATLRRYGRATTMRAFDVAPRAGVEIVADLSRADAVPSNSCDCFVVPFTAHHIFDIEAALFHAIRILRPGGILLINFPCVDYHFPVGLDMATGRPLFVFWWFTPLQVANLLRKVGLGPGDFELEAHGNLFARVAYQMNMPVEELTRHERDAVDQGHPLVICVRVKKPDSWNVPRPLYQEGWVPDVTPQKWNPRTGHYPADR